MGVSELLGRLGLGMDDGRCEILGHDTRCLDTMLIIEPLDLTLKLPLLELGLSQFDLHGGEAVLWIELEVSGYPNFGDLFFLQFLNRPNETSFGLMDAIADFDASRYLYALRFPSGLLEEKSV